MIEMVYSERCGCTVTARGDFLVARVDLHKTCYEHNGQPDLEARREARNDLINRYSLYRAKFSVLKQEKV